MIALERLPERVVLTLAERGYTFDGMAMRYRDAGTGRFVSERRMTALRDDVLSLSEDRLRLIGLNATNMTPAAVRAGLTQTTQGSIIVNYLLGAGGVNNMSEDDWSNLGALNRQAANGITDARWMDSADSYSDLQRQNFAGLNTGYAVAAYSQAQQGVLGIELPAHPAEGTLCGGNCRCAWSFKVSVSGKGANRVRHIEATWNANDDERVCATCSERAALYNPWTADVPLGKE